MSVAEHMTKNAACCCASDSLALAAGLLWRNDCGSVPVVDEAGRVQGMITDRDICMAGLTTGKKLADLLVSDAMARDVASIAATESLLQAEMLMRDRGVHRLPVIDAQQRVIGMLCSNDLLRWVDDGGANGAPSKDATHLVRTLAIIGRPRTPAPVPRTADAVVLDRPVELPTLGPGLPSNQPVLLGASHRDGKPAPNHLH